MRKKGLSNQEFLRRVCEYLPGETGICETDGSGKCLQPIPLATLQENTFYLFDSDALLAFSHTIEDFAMEAANGNLMAVMQDCRQFEPQRERYTQLAATLDQVQVIAVGKPLRPVRRLKFCSDVEAFVKKFWMVLYEGRKFQAMLLCEQANDSSSFEEKIFTGFYTFNSRIISETREDVARSFIGRCPEFRQFAQVHKIDRASKHLKIEFAREKKAIDIAITKLRSGKKYRPKHFIQDLDKTLERLNKLKTHLPELIIGKND